MLGFVSAHIPWNAISNRELRGSYNTLWSELVLPSAPKLSKICRREYTQPVYAIMKQLPWRTKVSLAIDGWTSTNKLDLMSVIAYSMDRNEGVREVQLAFDEVNSPFFSYFESAIRITGLGSTYWSTDSRIFDVSSWSFWAHWRPFTRYNNRERFFKLLNDSRITIYPWGLRNRVARIEKPHTMHGACHSAWFGSIHEQSWCKRPHQVLGSPWVQLPIWRESKHRHWEEPKTSKRGQC